MKRSLLAFSLISLCAFSLPAQEVVIQDATPFTYAYLECRGSYAQIPEKIGLFMQEFFKQNLMPAGNFFGMYLNAPGQVKEEELQWRLGFAIDPESAVAAPLGKGECQAKQMAVYLHVGPYDQVGFAYGKIFAFTELNGYQAAGPTIEMYLDPNPQAVKPEELRTEIHVPVVKKK